MKTGQSDSTLCSSISVRKTSTTAVLALLVIVNLSLILGYSLWLRKAGLTDPKSSMLEPLTGYRGVVLEPRESNAFSLLSFREQRKGREATTRTKNRGLVEEMKRCSLAMGMTETEVDTSMTNLTRVADKAQIFLDALRTIVPGNFSLEMKNPCWHSELTIADSIKMALIVGFQGAKQLFKFVTTASRFHMSLSGSQLYCLPYFFIAGFPKSGTTTLHEALQQHPQIARPTSKEPHWWTRIPLEDMNPDYLKLIMMEYLLYFSGAAIKIAKRPDDGMITYDGSQSTLWDSNFFMDGEDYCAMPAVVSRILPDLKFIVVMRNPVTREFSNFFYSCGPEMQMWPQHVQRDPAGQFHRTVQADTTIFKNCLEKTNRSMHRCIRQMCSMKGGCGRGHQGKRFTIGLYYVHLQKWLQFYPRENFLFLKTEEMCGQPFRTMKRITDFLKVAPVSNERAHEWLCHEANAQTVYSMDPEKFKMKPETRQLLEEFYKPFNVELAKLTGNDQFLWTSEH